MAPKFQRGDRVRINNGTFAGMEGKVTEVLEAMELLRVDVIIHGCPAPVELEYSQVDHLNEG